MLRQGGCDKEKDLQLFATCPIHLHQLLKLDGLVYMGHPAHPEVVDQRPILSHISHSSHGYSILTRLTKPWPIVQTCTARLSDAVSVVAMVAPVAKYHGGQITVLPAPCTWLVIQWRCGPSKQGSFMPANGSLQTKDATGDWIGCTYGLICWTK